MGSKNISNLHGTGHTYLINLWATDHSRTSLPQG
jgi:hypothetical protein